MTLSPVYLVPKIKIITDAELPIEIELSKTGMFDDRVLHIAVHSPSLMKLRHTLVDLLPDDIRARYEIGRDFSPHVTSAQAKPRQRLDATLLEQLRQSIDSLLPIKFEVRHLQQFTWT